MPIVLWDYKPVVDSVEGRTTILKTVLPPQTHPGPYERHSNNDRLSYVPSLGYFCIKSLLDYPDQIHVMGATRIRYTRNLHGFDILRELIPFLSSADFSMTRVDPRLWALLIQIYSHLPKIFSSYHIPLSDPHLPLLQRIHVTSNFALITILELRNCTELTDNTILQLKALHNLCALDASGTVLTGYGIKMFAKSLIFSEEGDKRGPWSLRVLRLRGCRELDSVVFDCLNDFPLLCAVDLRGTKCQAKKVRPQFGASPYDCIFDPIPLTDAMSYLSAIHSGLFSHPNPFTIFVTNSRHPERRSRSSAVPTVTMQDTLVVLPPSSGSTTFGLSTGKIEVQNWETLLKKQELEKQESQRTEKAGFDSFTHLHSHRNYSHDERTECESDWDTGEHTSTEDSDEFMAGEESVTGDEVDPATAEGDGMSLGSTVPLEVMSREQQNPTANHPSTRTNTAQTAVSMETSRVRQLQRFPTTGLSANSDHDRMRIEAAEEETLRERSNRAAEKFYRRNLSGRERKLADVQSSLKIATMFARRGVDGGEDPKLMLYRAPPTWSVMEAKASAIRSADTEKRKQASGISLVNRGMGKEALENWKEMMRRRKTTLAEFPLEVTQEPRGQKGKESMLFSRSTSRAETYVNVIASENLRPKGSAFTSTGPGGFKTPRPPFDLKRPNLPGSSTVPKLKLESNEKPNHAPSTSKRKWADIQTPLTSREEIITHTKQTVTALPSSSRLGVNAKSKGKQKERRKTLNRKSGEDKEAFNWRNWGRIEPK